jgi:hypothetical protein
MATKKRNGKPPDLTTEVLISIRDEIRHLRTDTNTRFESLEGGLEKLREETKAGLREVHDSLSLRLDKVIENTGFHYREMETRVSRIERDVDSLKGH